MACCCGTPCSCAYGQFGPRASCNVDYVAVDVTLVANACPGTWNYTFILNAANGWRITNQSIASAGGCVLRAACAMTCNNPFGFLSPENAYRFVLTFSRQYFSDAISGSCCQSPYYNVLCSDSRVASTSANVVLPSGNNASGDCCVTDTASSAWDRRNGDISRGSGNSWSSEELSCGGATLTINSITVVYL